MGIAVVVGNPKSGSRTLRVAMAVAGALQGTAGASAGDALVVELSALAPELFDPDSPAVDAALHAVARSVLLVVASPTYKATYTGLLKSFFDRYQSDALAGTVSVPVMTGAAPVIMGTRWRPRSTSARSWSSWAAASRRAGSS